MQPESLETEAPLMHTTAPEPHPVRALLLALSLATAVVGCGGQTVVEDTTERPARARYGNLEPSAHTVESHDHDGDGTPDAFDYLADGTLIWTERDTDFDGRVDFFEYYDRAGDVIERELQLDLDDAIDAVLHYSNGVLVREEISTGSDSTPSVKTYYDSRGQPQRVEHDRDGDGVHELVGTYRDGRIVRLGADTNGDGVPDRIETFD
jgi:hypothetical protein